MIVVLGILIMLIVFVVIVLLTPGGKEFVTRIAEGQWFTIGAQANDNSLDIIVSAHKQDDDSIPTTLPSTTTKEPEPISTGVPVIVPDEVVKDPEVFLIQDNIYEYSDAEPLCRAYNARLATMSDMYDAWRKGADWCSYGWVKDHKIVFPTQKESWLKLQESDEKASRNKCGLPGLNGGVVRDRTARYGVHCFGVKPPTWRNYKANKMAQDNLTVREQEMNSRSQYFKDRLNKYTIMPFKKSKWSEQYSTNYDT